MIGGVPTGVIDERDPEKRPGISWDQADQVGQAVCWKNAFQMLLSAARFSLVKRVNFQASRLFLKGLALPHSQETHRAI